MDIALPTGITLTEEVRTETQNAIKAQFTEILGVGGCVSVCVCVVCDADRRYPHGFPPPGTASQSTRQRPDLRPDKHA